WKNGVLLEFDNTRIRVIAEPLNRKIIIRAEGRNKTGALAIVRSEIGHIHDTLNHPEVREMIPCTCHECRNTETPHLYEYSILQKFRDKGRTTVTCNKSVEDMPIEELIMGITNQLQEWDVFIAFASEDFPTVSKIIKDMKRYNIRYWLDDEQIMPGDSISKKIENGLQKSWFIMPCLSRNQLESDWVRAEYSEILNRMLSGKTRQKVVPLILDNLDGAEIPHLLADIGYERYSDVQGYEKLLHNLKTWK
ncbi:MAG: toll/interleukin-1 receptor domain-containing protein, partial [Desulfobacterales bacterium]|nr:toll/interleukin-1 receptor domain-containing protein [Desulfobacterales bacterium]